MDDKMGNDHMDARRILTAVARAHRMTVDQLLEETRRPQITKPRQMAMLLMRELTTCSLPRIGEIMNRGGKCYDHTTIMYGVKRARHFVENDVVFRTTYLDLLKAIGPSQMRLARDEAEPLTAAA